MSHAATTTSGLAVYQHAVEAPGIAIRLPVKSRAPFKTIADQFIRGASSVPANLAEGHSRTGGDRACLWRVAYGLVKEVDCYLRLLVAAGVVNSARAEEALELFDRVRAMTWRLVHPDS